MLVDRDETACSYAQHNVVKAGRSGLCEVRQADLAEALQPEERFPIIIADPPWVPTASVGRFPEDPRSAIDGGPDGLDVTRACVQVIADHLSREGSAVVQLGSHPNPRCSPTMSPSDLISICGRGSMRIC